MLRVARAGLGDDAADLRIRQEIAASAAALSVTAEALETLVARFKLTV
jgi:hypothetical protein